jgi:uncharacterized SAM-binding protein YcdF (DUF218 family)
MREGRGAGTKEGEAARVDAIVVLGCRVQPSGALSSPAQGRVIAAARAFGSGLAPLVVASGGRRWGGHIEARSMARELVRRGVPRGAIAEEICSLSTLENAIFTAALLRGFGARTVAIATCAWHMPRALDAFRAAGLDATASPSLPSSVRVGQRARRWAHELIAQRLDRWRLARIGALEAGAKHLFRGRVTTGASPTELEVGPKPRGEGS